VGAVERDGLSLDAPEAANRLISTTSSFRPLLLDRTQIALSMLRTLALRPREVEQRIDAWIAS
jgi:hypothetical protein